MELKTKMKSPKKVFEIINNKNNYSCMECVYMAYRLGYADGYAKRLRRLEAKNG